MEQGIKESSPRVHRAIAIALPIVAIAMAVYHLSYTQYFIQGPTGHRITHLGFALVVVLLSLLLQSKKNWLLKWVLLLASLVVTGYLMFFLEPILEFRQSIPIPSDLAIGIMALFVTFAATYLIFGKTFLIIAGFFVGYLILGRFLPPPFSVAPVSIERLIMWLSAGVGLDQGIYGDILGIVANYVFLFILFGALLYAFGGVRFIIGVGQLVGSKLKSGPAAVAIVGSSLLGMMTGSTVANITITGAYTIPMMKEAGYAPKQAGAIEAASSNGGQIMPPIMGATAFVMAGFIGIPYIQVAVAAVLPALLYYLGLILYAQLNAHKLNIKVHPEPLNGRQLLLDTPLFVVPLGVLVFLMVKGFSLPYVAFWSMMTLIALGLISSIRKEARLSFKQVVKGLTDGVRTGCEVAVVCALIGIVATCIKVSGLGIKLPLLIQDISHGYLIIALAITMISSILLGMGVPTVAAYLLVAIGAAPALVGMGVPLLQAHLFCMVFAVFSHLTPPVAIGALVASRLAGSGYWETAWESMKAAFTAFLLPFFIVYAPILILRPHGGLIVSITQIVAIPLAVLSLQIALSNYCFTVLRTDERLAFGIAALLCLAAVFTQSYLLLLVGIALIAVPTIRQFIRRRQARAISRLTGE